MGKAEIFYGKLGVGIDVDFCKTAPGRNYYKYWAKYGLNIPMIFKDRGFSHLRIRVQDHPSNDLTLADDIALVVRHCIEAEVIPIVAYQGYSFKMSPNNLKEQAHLMNFWHAIAKRLDHFGSRVAFNFLIETTEAITQNPDTLNRMYQKINDMLREFSPGRIHIVCPHKVSSPESLPALVLPTIKRGDKTITDPNLIAESHWYAAGPQIEGKKSWGTGALGHPKVEEIEAIVNKVELAAQWMDDTGTPVWVGAWMSGNYHKILSDGDFHDDGAPMSRYFSVEQREEFTAVMMRQLKKHGLAHAINSDTKYYNRETNQWYKSQATILNKILGTSGEG